MNRKLRCFFFDGVTAKNLEKKNKKTDRSIKYENIVIVEQPTDRYLGFVSTTASDAKTIFDGMKTFFLINKFDLSELIAIGSDGAATNVGAENGVITKFENYLNRPLHRIICLLHLLELIMKAMISHYYGTTKAPNTFTGKINEQLTACDKNATVNFTPIALENMPTISGNAFDASRLTKDQKLLFDLSEAVSTGYVSADLALRQPGCLSNLRWTTYGSRFLRLYMSDPSPSFKLISMVRFIQKVYVPMLFWIKCYSEWENGPDHIFKILSFSQTLPIEQFKVVKARIEHNSYFLHSENILLAMIRDKDTLIRRNAYKMIIYIRKRDANQSQENVKVRAYSKPVVNFNHPDLVDINQNGSIQHHDHYSTLLNCNDMDSMYEPPITKDLSLNQLLHYMHSVDDIIKVPLLPAHSQATEHNVQLVKSVITKYVGHETQEKRIQTKIRARSLNRELNSQYRKSDYKTYEI